MTDQTAGSGIGSPSPNGGAPPALGNPVTKPANPPPDFFNPQPNPRSAGFSPALQQRARAAAAQQSLPLSDTREGEPQQAEGQQQQPPAAPATYNIDGAEFSADDLRSALKHQSEDQIRRSGLPAAPENYELKLPADFQAPQGISFEFDNSSAELQNFRRLAHARGIDQQTFSDALGVYAAAKIGEQQNLAVARDAEMKKLGAAASNRISAVETWLKSQVGSRATLIANQLRNFPVAGMVEMFEQLARNASSQGGATAPSGGHVAADNSGRIPGYETMNYSQRRAAQDQLNARRGGR